MHQDTYLTLVLFWQLQIACSSKMVVVPWEKRWWHSPRSNSDDSIKYVNPWWWLKSLLYMSNPRKVKSVFLELLLTGLWAICDAWYHERENMFYHSRSSLEFEVERGHILYLEAILFLLENSLSSNSLLWYNLRNWNKLVS